MISCLKGQIKRTSDLIDTYASMKGTAAENSQGHKLNRGGQQYNSSTSLKSPNEQLGETSHLLNEFYDS